MQPSARLPLKAIVLTVIIRERIAYLVICDSMTVIRGEQILPACFIGIYIAVLCDLSARIGSCNIRYITEFIISILGRAQVDSHAQRAVYLFCKLILSVIIIINKGIRNTVVPILRVLYIADIIIAIVGKRLLSAEGIPHGGHIGNYAVWIAAVCLIGIRYSARAPSDIEPETDAPEVCVQRNYTLSTQFCQLLV